MPLKIEMSPESVRSWFADGCGEPIVDARDGNYQWQAPVDPGLSRDLSSSPTSGAPTPSSRRVAAAAPGTPWS